MYHKGRKIYPGLYEYRGYWARKVGAYWQVYDNPALKVPIHQTGAGKADAYRWIDNLYKGKEVKS